MASSPVWNVGTVKPGRPAGIVPTLSTPLAEASITTAITLNNVSETRAAGILGIFASSPSITMTVPNARAAVVQLAWSSSLRVWVSLSQVLPLAGTPSIPDRLPMISETPTPDRNPASTGWEIRSARNSSFATANSSRNTAVRIAQNPDSGGVLRGALGGDQSRPGGDQGGGGRVRPDHELPRGADQGEHQRREQRAVQAGLDRQSGDLGVPEALRDRDGRHRDSGDHIPAQPAALVVVEHAHVVSYAPLSVLGSAMSDRGIRPSAMARRNAS